MTDLIQRQLDLETEYSTASLVAGQQQILDAFKQGRVTDVGSGRLLLAQAFEAALESFETFLKVPTRGIGGKYKALLKHAEPSILVMAGLREVINGCANPEAQPMQSFLRNLGRIIESESMLASLYERSPAYTSRTVQYLDSAGTKSVTHRYRTFLAGAKSLGLEWEQWSNEERIHTARMLCTVLYDSTGIFQWGQAHHSTKVASGMYYLRPSDELSKHFNEVQAAARAVVKYPPMLIPPMPWLGQNDGGYYTDWFRVNSPMCGLRFIKREDKAWVLKGLESSTSAPVRAAMDKAQSVPYRVNRKVLSVLREAISTRLGILGLPSHQPAPKPVFPLAEGWAKDEATEAELDAFQFWKTQMAEWYTSEANRMGKKVGILSKLRELDRYQHESRLYFPAFIDWRGRMYFRSTINPQSNDSIKGCIEFAEGKRLGTVGLFWLKVHVANSCGFDKHDPVIKAKWCDDNWGMIQDFINNPMDIDAPESDTAFVLLQAGLALQEALDMPNPEDYVCHTPVAMDATCSG